MEDLTCKKCGFIQSHLEAKIEKRYMANGGFHLMAFCSGCGCFLKNIPHELPGKLYFGKYKGMYIKEVLREDPGYLRWLLRKDIKDGLRQSIMQALEVWDAKRKQQSINLR